MLIDGDRAAIEVAPPGLTAQQQKEHSVSRSVEAATAGPSGSGSGGSGAGVDPSLSPLISQIRDMLPEYGSGFLAACLEHYSRKAEQARGTHVCWHGAACPPRLTLIRSLLSGPAPALACPSPLPPPPPLRCSITY